MPNFKDFTCHKCSAINEYPDECHATPCIEHSFICSCGEEFRIYALNARPLTPPAPNYPRLPTLDIN